MCSCAAFHTLLCPVLPLLPPATLTWQQQGQEGDIGSETDTGDHKTVSGCLVQYLCGSSWATSRREGWFRWDMVRLVSLPLSGLCMPGCFPQVSCMHCPELEIPANPSCLQGLFSFAWAKVSPRSGYTSVSVTYKGRGRIFQGKVIKVCDKMLRNPNINSLKNNSNCVRNSSFQVFV